MVEEVIQDSNKLDQILSSSDFKGTKKQPKPKAVTISSNGVICFNTHLKAELYKAGGKNRKVVIRVNAEENQILIMVGDTDDRVVEHDATVGATNCSISAIETFRLLEDQHNTTILPSGEKTASYRYEDRAGALEVLKAEEGFMAVLLKRQGRKRNRKLPKVEVTVSEDTD